MYSDDTKKKDAGALDADILRILAEAEQPAVLPTGLAARMRETILGKISTEEQCTQPGFKTIRANEGEWIEARPGAFIKILHQEGDSGLMSYLARLHPGFEMEGHPHPFDEECIMLEGDLSLGQLTLRAGDYHYASRGVYHGRLRSEAGALVYLKGALPGQ